MLVLAMEFSRSAPVTRAQHVPGAGGGSGLRPRPPLTADGGAFAPSQRNRGGPTFSVAGVQARPGGLRTCPLAAALEAE